MLGFRVWDSISEIMIGMKCDKIENSVPFCVDCRGVLSLPYLIIPPPERFMDDSVNGLVEANEYMIPMQSTGLITEDHKPIFEGDIIGWEDGTHLQLVEDATTFVGRMGSSCEIQPDGKMILFYIHGNKYSNPELLEKIKC